MQALLERIERTYHRGFRPDPHYTVSEWADRFRILPKKSAAEAGRYRTSRTPYLREVMDSLSPSCPVEQVKVMKATQLGFTEVGINWFGFIVDRSPGPMMMVLPTDEVAKRHSRHKIAPSIEEMPILKERIREARARDAGNTILQKDFTGGYLVIGGANSAATFRHASIRYLFLDDIDGYPLDVAGEGDPVGLAENRTDAFSNRKIYKVSTPTTKGLSRIEQEFEDSDQRRYYVPCPHCHERQPLIWSQVRFEKDDKYNLVGDPWYECAHCGERIDEHHKTWMLEQGEWIPENPGHPHRGYHINSLYSPLGWLSWRKIVEEFLKAKKLRDETLLKKWVNTRLAETWSDGDELIDQNSLMTRAESYSSLWLPEGVLVLTAGVDVQEDRIEIEVVGWGKGEESWSIDWVALHGNTAQGRVWQDLDNYLQRRFQHALGFQMPISCTCIDSGFRAKEVYEFVRPRQSRNIYVVKGSSQRDVPLIAKFSKHKHAKVKIFSIGTTTAKDTIYSRLKIDTFGPGYMHFPAQYPEEYFLQLTSEKLFYEKGKRVYKKVRARNEAIDLRVYNMAALAILNPNWDKLEERILKYAEGLKHNSDDHEIEQETQTKKPRKHWRKYSRRGWVNGWRS